MLKKLKNNKIEVLELAIIFIITLILNITCTHITNDEIWNYGFSYNIATGLIPYKDFNMVITPLFPMLGAIFMTIFGKNLIIYHIFNSIICISIFHYMKKQNPQSYYITYSILLLYSLPNYSLFCILLLYILISLEEKKANDYLIGIVLGLTFLTKQNIGIYLCIPTLFIKNINKIIKRFIGFIFPILILILYLINNNCLYEFIDYAFLGISSFAKQNIFVSPTCLLLTIIILIYLIFRYIKKREIKILYTICIQGLAFPLIDPYHVILPFMVGLNYLLNNLNLNKKIIKYSFLIFITFILSYNAYEYSTTKYNYPNTTKVYKYRKINTDNEESIKIVSEYLKNTADQVFIIDPYAYLIKLESNKKINKYDLLNDGNMGKSGEIKITKEIDKICQKENCTFILNKYAINNEKSSQYSQYIYKHIINNYKERDKLFGLSIYKNY